jgi:hypothetical protein
MFNGFRSYAVLGTVVDVDENTVIEAYNKQVEDDPAHLTFYHECLEDIGISTSARKIRQFVDRNRPDGIYTRFDLQRAYRTLEIDMPDEIGDDGIVAVFYSRCADLPEREREFQAALDTIQHFRGPTIQVTGPEMKKGYCPINVVDLQRWI